MNLLSRVVLLFSILSLLYYGGIVYYAGFQSSFAWLWLVAGIGGILLYNVLRYIIRHGIHIPGFLIIMAIGGFLIAFVIFVSIEGMIIYHANCKAKPGMDYIIVLGAQVRGTRITRSLKERLDKAADYLEENPSTTAIVSGGKGEGEEISEAEAMKNYLINRGIEKSRIITENKSTNTHENILFSKKFITRENARVAIVTNGFHVFRAKRIAIKQGLTRIQGIAAPSDPVLFLNYYVREFFGVLKELYYRNI